MGKKIVKKINTDYDDYDDDDDDDDDELAASFIT